MGSEKPANRRLFGGKRLRAATIKTVLWVLNVL